MKNNQSANDPSVRLTTTTSPSSANDNAITEYQILEEWLLRLMRADSDAKAAETR